MTVVRPRASAHRGSVVAVGFVIDGGLLGAVEARRRVLALWRPGATVRARGDALIVTGLAPRRVRVTEAPGGPLVEQDGLLAAAPLTARERTELARAAPAGTVIGVEGGVASPWRLAVGEAADVASWLELDALELLDARPLAAPAAVARVPAPPTVDLRALVGLGPADAGATGLRAALAGEGAPAGPPSWWQRVTGWMARRAERGRPARAALPPDASTAPGDAAASAGGRAREVGGPAAGGDGRAPLDDDVGAARPGWRQRLRAQLGARLWTSWFGSVLGRRHGRYLGETLALFDRGELDLALRRALPLGGEASPDAGPALAVPPPRTSLAPSIARARHGSYVPLPAQAAELLRQRYRQALERLIREQRIDEAAFVLADLLGEVDAAIDLLERHGRHALAARLAEGRRLEPALIVRLWLLAGDRARAVAIARRHQAWAAALTWLERRGDALASGLRWAWAEQLAAAGAYGDAVAVAAPLLVREPSGPQRATVLAWLDLGLALDDDTAARLAVARLALAPDDFAGAWPRLAALLGDRAPGGAARRRALSRALTEWAPSPPLRAVARAAVRALWRDRRRAVDGDELAVLERDLLSLAGDAALRADQPPPRARASAATPTAPVRLRWAASDVGQLAIADAALLPGGRRLLVALGELGVRVLATDGRVLAHVDQPATELVIADHGARALATIRRDRLLRIARLDLIARTGQAWTVVECDGGAASYDGDQWLTWRGGEVLAIDATGPGWQALWGVDTRAPIRGLERHAERFAILTADELWLHDRMVLRERRPLPPATEGTSVLRLAAPRAGARLVTLSRHRGATTRLSMGDQGFDLGPLHPGAFACGARSAAVASRAADGVEIVVLDLERGRSVADIDLAGATTAALRLDERADQPALTIADDRGRLIVLEPTTGAVRVDLRLRA